MCNPVHCGRECRARWYQWMQFTMWMNLEATDMILDNCYARGMLLCKLQCDVYVENPFRFDGKRLASRSTLPKRPLRLALTGLAVRFYPSSFSDSRQHGVEMTLVIFSYHGQASVHAKVYQTWWHQRLSPVKMIPEPRRYQRYLGHDIRASQ